MRKCRPCRLAPHGKGGHKFCMGATYKTGCTCRCRVKAIKSINTIGEAEANE